MGRVLKSLGFRVGASVVLIEVVVLLVMGIYAVQRLSNEIDRRTRDRITIPGLLMERGVLDYDTVSDSAIMSNLIGQELVQGMVVGANRNVFHALDARQLGQDVRDLPGIDPAWFSSNLRAPSLISVEEGEHTFLVSVTPLFIRDAGGPVLFTYVKVNTTALTQQKQALARHVLIAALVCIVLTSATIFLVFRAAVLRRITGAVGFVRRIGAGEAEVPPLAVGADEFGLLEHGINGMAEDLDQRARQRDRMEENLRGSQKRFRDFAASSSDWFWELNADLCYTDISDRFFELVGTSGSLLGRPANQLGVEAISAGGWPALMEALRRRETVRDFDISWVDAGGHSRYARLAGIPVFDQFMIFVGYRGTGSDITLLRQAHAALERRVEERTVALRKSNADLQTTLDNLNRAHAELVRTEKLAALGALVAGVAHEINTPIGIAVTAASYLRDETRALGARVKEGGGLRRSELVAFIDSTIEATILLLSNTRRAAAMIQSFKQVATDRTDEFFGPFNVRDHLDATITSMMSVLSGTRHTVQIDCDHDLEITGYPGLVSQVISDLVMNSVAHGYDEGASGSLTVRVRPVNAEFVEIVYADDGKGVAPEVLSKIFDPFFTTRRGAGHTGLGLHIVHNIVTNSLKGRIEVRSEPAKGATFVIQLPQTLETAQEPTTPPGTLAPMIPKSLLFNP